MENKNFKISESSEFISSFIKHIPIGVIIINNFGGISYINQLSIDYLVLDKDIEIQVDKNIVGLIDHVPELRDIIEQYLKKEIQEFSVDSLWIEEGCYIIKGSPIINRFMITIENITKLLDMEANSIQSILEGQEKERRRIGREIHDGIGPMLSVVKLNLDSFSDEVKIINEETSLSKLNEAVSTIDTITTDLRNLSHQLIPKVLDEFGLSAAFNTMINRLNSSKKMGIDFYGNFNSETRFSKDIELNLFRCGQELLNNIIKHAAAKEIMVQLIKHEDSIVLMVEDDGAGFLKEELKSENYGIGLTNIETRIRMLDGEFAIESAKGRGTSVCIEVPL